MGAQEPTLHYVCTRDEARKLAAQRDKFWVSNCGCREGGPGCKRSRIDVCLIFSEFDQGSGTGLHEVSKKFVEGIFKEAEDKHLVTRPFRNPEDKTVTDGICFCCDDCCGYFKDTEEACDKGRFIEQTDMEACTLCGECVPVCYFKARKMVDGKLAINQEGCYGCAGCGLCLDVCPEDCIEMVKRS